jgi:hypothetical protein
LQSASSTPVEGYRAGGLFIQPFSDIKSFFETCKLQYEFSVYKGFTSIHDTMKCDFSQAPDSTIYRFEEDVCKESKEGKFTQFSISNFEMKGISRVINSIYYRYIIRQPKSKRYGKGQGARHVLSNNEKHVSMWDTVNESFSVELMNPWKNTLYANYLKTHTYLHFLSHPKLVSEMNLESLDAFLSQAKKKYEVEFDFKKFNY